MAKKSPASNRLTTFGNIQNLFTEARDSMSRALIERSTEIDLVLTGLVAKENCLLVGPPGTAKSHLLDALVSWFGDGTKKFSYLLTKFTTPEELFGPVSLKGLKEDKYRRITTGKLPECDIGFVDEVFKANSAILNTMLKIMNERIYENGDGRHDCPLLSMVAGSNEYPNSMEGGRELGAMFDRFMLRKNVKPIASKEGLLRLLWDDDTDLTPKFESTITRGDADAAVDFAKNLAVNDDAAEKFLEILETLKHNGIIPGDRRKRKSVRCCKAYAFITGKSDMDISSLRVLAHTLWDDPAQADQTQKIVEKIVDPLGQEFGAILIALEEIYAKACDPNLPTGKLSEAKIAIMDVQTQLGKMPDHADRALLLEKASEYFDNVQAMSIGKKVR